jgi:site-specific recombinase XerC
MVFDTEREAKKHAYRDASFRLSEYITQSIDMDYSEMNVAQSASTNVINQSYATKERNKTSSRSVISKISAWRTWVEPVFDQNEQLGYSAFAMVRVPTKSVKSATQHLKKAAIPEGPVANLDNL